jgi:hypothetical protein
LPTSQRQPALVDDLTNIRFGATDEKTGLDLAFYLDNVFDVAGDVYIAAATATPTAKYTTSHEPSESKSPGSSDES